MSMGELHWASGPIWTNTVTVSDADTPWTDSRITSWPTITSERLDPNHCVICRSVATDFFCELCRQAILDLRRQVIERMARELLEME